MSSSGRQNWHRKVFLSCDWPICPNPSYGSNKNVFFCINFSASSSTLKIEIVLSAETSQHLINIWYRNKIGLSGSKEDCSTEKLTYGSLSIELSKTKLLSNITNRLTNFPNLFCQETLHVSGSSSVHHQEFSTAHSALVYVMQLSSTTRMELQFHPGRA